MEDTIYWIWLSRVTELNSIDKRKLLEKYNLKQLWRLSKEEVFEILKNEEKVKAFFNINYKYNLEKHLEYMKLNGIKLISLYDTKYPTKLKNIYDFPVVLYAKGNIDILNNLSIAVVGARNASDYGKKVSNIMSYNLARNNINVVSGLAKGIDTNAHIGAINAKRDYSSCYR